MKPSDFEISSCQASIFTPFEEVQPRKIMVDFYPRWADFFDDDPIVQPLFPAFPREVPKVLFQSKGGTWRCEIASERINIFWFKIKEEAPVIKIESFFHQASELIIDYFNSFSPQVGRLAALITRFIKVDRPGFLLSRHFCKQTWHKAPLDTPGNFELHAHKRYFLDKAFQVNSWARSKTGKLTKKEEEVPVILFEQDINTLSEDIEQKDFGEAEIKHFFTAVVKEFDIILELYFPS